MPRRVTTASAKRDAPRIRAKKLLAASSPCSASFLDKTGTSALETAPSPRSCRRALGIVNATKKASVSSRVNSAASAMSRPSPKTRETSVPAPTTDARCTSLLRSARPSERADSAGLSSTRTTSHQRTLAANKSFEACALRSRNLGVACERRLRAASGALADGAKVLVRVEPRPVPVEPLDAERIVADDLEVFDLKLDSGAFEKADGARVALAPRARAISAQNLVRVDALVAVPPVDLGRLGSAWRANRDAAQTRAVGHGSVFRHRSVFGKGQGGSRPRGAIGVA